ncbi:MAG: DMT family transporter [Aestuariivirga sp.]
MSRLEPSVTPRSTLLAFAALAFTVLVWGVTPVFVRSFALEAGPADSLVIRHFLVSGLFLILLPFFGGFHIAREDWPRLLVASLVGMLGYNLGSVFGFARVTASVGGIIIATQPLLIALFAAVMGTEKLTPAAILGLVISFGGSLFLFRDDGASGLPRNDLLLGSGLIFLSGTAWSIYVVLCKPLIQRYGSYKISALTLAIAALPLVFMVSRNTLNVALNLNASAFFALFFLVVVATFMALMLWNYATGVLRPTAIGATLYLVPVLAVVSGYVLLREVVTTNTLITGAIILLGVAVAQFGPALKPRASLAGLAAVIFAVTMWGMVPVVTRYLVLNLPPETVMVLRVFPAGIIGLFLAIYLGVKPMPWSAWSRIAIAALIGNVGYQVLAVFGAQYIPASWMGMLFGLEPVFIAFFAVILAGDRLTTWLVGGMALALTGTATLMLGNFFVPARDVGLLGLVLVTFATMGWGIYTVVVRPVSVKYGAIPVACLTLGVSSFPMLLFVTPELPQALAGMTGFQWLTVGYLVIVCTFMCTLAWNYAMGHMSSSLAGMFLYVQPLVAAIGGIVLLGEKLSLPLIAGGLLIIAGVAVAQFGSQLSKERLQIRLDNLGKQA